MTKQSSRSVFSGTLENKLKKPRVQSRTNNETQSKSLFYYLVQTIKMIIKRAKIGIANTINNSVLTYVNTKFQVGLKLGPMKLTQQVI